MKAVDFFSGAGGVTCGFSQVGIDVLAGIDNERLCEKTYVENNKRLDGQNINFICKDIASLTPEELRNYLPELQVNDDEMIFVGCSPCQYYTHLTKNKKKSEESKTLLEEFRRFVEYFQPGYVFIENVPGLQTNAESPLGNFKVFLTDNGYQYDDGVLNAKYFQVPQNRRRYILIATRLNNINNAIRIEKQNTGKIRTVRDAIGNMNIFHPIGAGTIDDSPFQHSSAALSLINLKRLANTPLDGGDRRSWAANEKLQLKCYKNHSGHTDVYGRMAWDKPAPAITTRFCSISNGRYGHPEQLRAISLREGAALQSFPNNYVFYANSQGAIARMIGNAVPPLLASSIGQTINQHFLRWQILRQVQEL
ncbi:DNA cytosine methyltransferase [Phocaeicola sp.]